MPSFTNHPARLAAQAAGHKQFHGPDCSSGHGGVRWVSSGNCVACSRDRARESARRKAAADLDLQARRKARLQAREAREAARKARTPLTDHPARLAALAAGERTWRGPDCHRGHGGLRYTSNTVVCVECKRISNRKASKWN